MMETTTTISRVAKESLVDEDCAANVINSYLCDLLQRTNGPQALLDRMKEDIADLNFHFEE
jgi:hypothetical protein